jgi:glucose-6-phosphate-specific signal transduction histidine kinase
MSRRVVWLQLLIGWVPVWVLFASLILAAHADATAMTAVLVALRMMATAALLGILVQRFTERLPWPRPMRLSFVGAHLVASIAFAVVWMLLNSVIESVERGRPVFVVGYSIGGYVMLGIWLYLMIAGVSYMTFATERATRAEANAAKSQLAALRSQLNPHFLFNALHTVVQLIPREPKRAAQAAEQLAGLLRGTIEEDRDLVPMVDEWAFVERYLELERLRFGDRLRVHVDMSDDAKSTLIPLFALQTLVENAVRHGAAPRIEATEVNIRAATENGTLTVTVRDTGDGASVEQLESNGTGLKRLRERLLVLYGPEARLEAARERGGGFTASLVIPRVPADA